MLNKLNLSLYEILEQGSTLYNKKNLVLNYRNHAENNEEKLQKPHAFHHIRYWSTLTDMEKGVALIYMQNTGC